VTVNDHLRKHVLARMWHDPGDDLFASQAQRGRGGIEGSKHD